MSRKNSLQLLEEGIRNHINGYPSDFKKIVLFALNENGKSKSVTIKNLKEILTDLNKDERIPESDVVIDM